MQGLKRLVGGIGARRLGLAAGLAAVTAVGLLGSAPAFADPPYWHHHYYDRGYYGYGYRPGVVVTPPPVVYAGPPAYYAPAPPPPAYYAPPPPVVYGTPGVSLGVTIPIR
jgi:hypothetical protein